MELTPARLRTGAVLGAFALAAVMAAVAQPGGDQLNLLARGWLLAARGELVPFGNPLSTGGDAPGPATAVVVGAPLALVSHHRAPVALVWLCHLVAYLLLDRALRSALTPIERTAFAVVWALGPWRMAAGETLWNPNFLVLVGAVHLATSLALAERPRFGATFAQVLALGLGAQLHPSVLLLGVLSLLLWARGDLRPSWPGFAAGLAVIAATLAPWLAAAAERPEIAAAEGGFPFRGLVFLFPLLKGMAYLVRYPSLYVGHEASRFDFTERLGAATDGWLTPAVRGFEAVVGAASVALVALALVGFVRAAGLESFRRAGVVRDERTRLVRYVCAALVAALAVFAADPTTPQSWQALPLLHVSVVPVAWGAGRLARRRGERGVLRLLAAWAVVALLLDVALAAGGRDFRCGGRDSKVVPLRSTSPMFEELGLQRECPWPLGVPGGWWPDVLPES